MKLIRVTKTKDYHEIVVEFSFLWIFKWRRTYRKSLKENTIMGYIHPNQYYDIGISRYIEIKQLFKLDPKMEDDIPRHTVY